MRVTVRLFARLRELAGRGEFSASVALGATVEDVWRAAVDEHPALAPYAGSVSAAVNAAYAKLTARVADGDDVAFLPPVSGG
jgi:molybdopterin converting factor small subunit